MAVAVRGGGDVTVRQRWCNKIGEEEVGKVMALRICYGL